MYNRTDGSEREYGWDPEKSRANYEKRVIRFARAAEIFEDDRLYVEADTFSFEERFVDIGKDNSGIVLAVVFAWRGQRTRIISSWKANKQEREFYEGEA